MAKTRSRAGFVRMDGGSTRGTLMLIVLAAAVALGSWTLFADGGQDGEMSAHAGMAIEGPPAPAFRYDDATQPVLFRAEAASVPVAADPSRVDDVPIRISRHTALAAARDGTLEVELPDGTRYPVRYERGESAPGGTWTFIGRVDTTVGDLAAVITFGRDGVFGLLPTPDGTMMEITTRAGQAFLRPAGGIVPPGADPRRDPDFIVPPVPEPERGAGAQASAPSSTAGAGAAGVAPAKASWKMGQAATDGEVSIDVLATYTSNLVTLRGSKNAAEAEFQNLVAVANQAHIDSGSRVRLRIADFVEIDYPAGATNRDVLYTVTDGDLPDGTDIRALRDAAAADLVAVIRPYAEGDTTCGIAWLPGPDLIAYSLDAGNGYSVTAVEACSPLVLAHEVGHNLGLMHDRDTVLEQSGGALAYGAFPFSFGYRQDGPPAFATVMAYDVGDQVWINRFSHPGSTLCEGVACGIAEESDSVRSLNLTADTVSRFRDPLQTISIFDARVLESDDEARSIQFYIRTSTPAPEGGVTFEVAVTGGTALAGQDWQPDASWETPTTIPAGGDTAAFRVEVQPDSAVEGDESILVGLANVQGMTVFDADAVGTIQDDDPRVTVSGRLRFPGGIAKPAIEDIGVYAEASGLGGLFDGGNYLVVTDYRYEALVPKGGNLDLSTFLPAPFLAVPEPMVGLQASVAGVDVPVDVGVRFSGKLRSPVCEEGCNGIPVILWNPRGNGYGYYVNYHSDGSFWGYDSNYEMLVLTDAPMQLEVRDPPAPFVRQLVEIPSLNTHAAWDIELREVPSLTIAHETVVEGPASQHFQRVEMIAELSMPAPPGGVTFDIQPGGSADGADFALTTRTFTIAEGATTADVSVIIGSDDEAEPDETLELQVTNIQGAAWNPGPGSIRIVTDESHEVDSGACVGATAWPAVRMCH